MSKRKGRTAKLERQKRALRRFEACDQGPDMTYAHRAKYCQCEIEASQLRGKISGSYD